MSFHFFAYISRLRYIRRWGLMRNTQPENDAEHSLQTAFIAHAIAVIGNKKYGRQCNPEHILALAAYHDVTEVLTGDMPTPVKYQSGDLRGAYKQVEKLAANRLVKMLPEDMQQIYSPYLNESGNEYDRTIVKAADRISAYIKCMEEKSAGNHEFDAAGENTLAAIKENALPEVMDFMTDYVPSFALTLDELNGGEKL